MAACATSSAISPRIALYLGGHLPTDLAGRVGGQRLTVLSGTAALNCTCAFERRVRLAQEIEGFKDDEARDDAVGRGDDRDDIAPPFLYMCQ